MRKLAIIIVVILQVAVLGFMAGQREYILRTGRVVFLKTVPVDPRDIFRGDYVRLGYEISTVTDDMFRDGLPDLCKKDPEYPHEYERNAMQKMWDKQVYAMLNVGEDDIAELVYLTDKKPLEGLFIRGRINFPFGSGFGRVNVRYGIEAYFVEQGKGKEIEEQRFGQMRVPLEMEAAIGKSGIAVLKGYRWGPLGIGIEEDVEEVEDEESSRPIEKLKGVTVKLINKSDKPIGIIDLLDGGSFALEPASMLAWYEKEYEWVGTDAERKKLEDGDVRILQPGGAYEFYMDVNQPQWFVAKGKEEPQSIADLYNSFQLVYNPPSKDECHHLKDADLIWHGRLESAPFKGFSWLPNFAR